MLVKKYSNRRLYDTQESRYITLDELSGKIKDGHDVQVVDAKSGVDLTQTTLAQIILESRGAAKLLPTPLLMRLIRMEEDALTDFMGRYMSWALELYLQTKRQAQAMQPYNPFAAMPFNASTALAQMLSPWGAAQPPMPGGPVPPPPAPAPAPAPPTAEGYPPTPSSEAAGAAPQQSNPNSDLADLRRELEELKKSLGR